ISEPHPDPSRSAPPVDLDMPPPPPPPVMSPATPSFDPPPFEPRASAADRPMFEPIEEPQPQPPVTRRAANDDRETPRPLLQSLQQGPPARSVSPLATIFAGIWLVGCVLLTVSFIGSLQAAIGQSGGVLVLGGLAALFFAPVLLFYFLASLAWRGQEMRMIA